MTKPVISNGISPKFDGFLTCVFLPGNQLSVDYRYPIFHKESKRKILLKGFALIVKAISQQFLYSDNY